MDKFLEIYGTLPRAGPGSNALTRRAFHCLKDLPPAPQILDIGCGPGMQTIELLKLSGGNVVAVDMLEEMLSRVRASATRAGVAERLTTLQQDVREMSIAPASYDIIWSEGAVYVLGFEAGLRKLGNFLRPGGYLAVSEAVWLKPYPPQEAVEFWKEYPEIDSVEEKLKVIERLNFKLIDHFLFPPAAWTDDYYDPMEKRIAEKAPQWRGDAEGEAVLESARSEIAIFRRCSDYYSYAFFVMRKDDVS